MNRRALPSILLLAACGGSHPTPAPASASGTAVAAAPDAASAGGAATVSGNTVTVTLAGVTSVSHEPCRDEVGFDVENGGGWTHVIQQIPDKMYWLDGTKHGPSMCDVSPCQTEMASGGDATLRAELSGFEKVADQDGLPAYQTASLQGEIKVTFSYSTDRCQTWQTYQATVTR